MSFCEENESLKGIECNDVCINHDNVKLEIRSQKEASVIFDEYEGGSKKRKS